MTYTDRHAALVAYLKMKVEQQDWHGVADAAMDLRELEAWQKAASNTQFPPCPLRIFY